MAIPVGLFTLTPGNRLTAAGFCCTDMQNQQLKKVFDSACA
jgi:hypothetical protein